MINLLPPASKKSINYAHQNTILLKACLATLAVIAGVVLLVGLGNFYIASSTDKYQEQNSALQKTLQDQDIDQVKSQIQDLSGSVNLVLKVLSKEILFSKLLRQAGSVMPTGSSLLSLEISDDQKAIDISAGVQDYQAGTQVQVNLADKNNKLFQKVDLVSVQCSPGAVGPYPCSARLRALFGDNSPYLFINNNTGSN